MGRSLRQLGSRKYLMASLDQSLARMRLDYVDVFYSHRFDPETPLEETLQALVDIVRQGKALYVGLSRYPKDALAFAVDYLRARDVPCLCYQGRFNLLDREIAAPGGVLAQAAAAGLGFVGFLPLAEGLLTDRYLHGIPAGSRMARREHLTETMRTPEALARVAALNEIAASRGETLAQMSLAWILQHPGVTSVLLGPSSVAQLDENLKALGAAPFTEGQLDAIARA